MILSWPASNNVLEVMAHLPTAPAATGLMSLHELNTTEPLAWKLTLKASLLQKFTYDVRQAPASSVESEKAG